MVARPFGALQMTLTAEFEAHNFRLFLKEFLVADAVSADEDADVRDADTLALLSSAMELSRSKDIADAEAMLLVWQGRHEEALNLLLERLGDVGGALQLVVSAPFETAETLWEQFLSFALRDPRSCTLLLTLLGPSTPFELKSGSLVQIVRRLPRGLEVPRQSQHDHFLSRSNIISRIHGVCPEMHIGDCFHKLHAFIHPICFAPHVVFSGVWCLFHGPIHSASRLVQTACSRHMFWLQRVPLVVFQMTPLCFLVLGITFCDPPIPRLLESVFEMTVYHSPHHRWEPK